MLIYRLKFSDTSFNIDKVIYDIYSYSRRCYELEKESLDIVFRLPIDYVKRSYPNYNYQVEALNTIIRTSTLSRSRASFVARGL